MLEPLSKLNALCQYDDTNRSVVHVCHIGVQLSKPSAPIHNQCEGDEINCDKPKSNEKMSLQNAKRCNITVRPAAQLLQHVWHAAGSGRDY